MAQYFVKSFDGFEPLSWETIQSKPPVGLMESMPSSDPTPVLVEIANLIGGKFLGWTMAFETAFGFHVGSSPVILTFRVEPEIFADCTKLVTFARRRLFGEALSAAQHRCSQLQHDVEDLQSCLAAAHQENSAAAEKIDRLEARIHRLSKARKKKSKAARHPQKRQRS